MLSNYLTDVKARVDANKDIRQEERDALVELVLGKMKKDIECYSWDADIHGITIRLVTNSFHLYDFWVENWFPGLARAGILPHGYIYAISNMDGHEPYVYYHHESRTAIFVNTEYYGQCKSWALGIAADIMETQHDIHSIHGACAVVNGRGIIIIAPTGTGKSTHTWGLTHRPDGQIHSDDWVFIKYKEDEATAYISERKFYLRTDMVKSFPELKPLLDRCKCENVVDDNFTAFANSRAILDPKWIGGEQKFVESADVRVVILLRRDDISPPEVRMQADEAISTLEEGKAQVLAGAGGDMGMIREEPYYNPYLLVRRTNVQRRFFKRLFDLAPCYILNTGVESVEETQQRINRIIEEV